MPTKSIVAPKKLIEVALPLEDINKAAGKEKSIRHGHPSTLHLWWARRPLAATRAVLFAQLVNDPSWKYSADELRKPQVRSAVTRKRNELFRLISELVQWENSTNPPLLARARTAITQSWQETCEANASVGEPAFSSPTPPPFLDPFAGGGAIPLEALRLGLESHASDLNPVAVLINKAMIEIPPRFSGSPPVGPLPSGGRQESVRETVRWLGAAGLAEDVRRYGAWMRDKAHADVARLYPELLITKPLAKDRPEFTGLAGKTAPVIAWLWARTVASPSPAYASSHVPLVTTWYLSKKEGREVWLEPEVSRKEYSLKVRGKALGDRPPADADEGTKQGRGANFKCLLSGVAITPEYIKQEGMAGRIGYRLLAIVVDAGRGRVYVEAQPEHETAASSARPEWKPDQRLPNDPRNFWTVSYGLQKYSDLFTSRQLSTLGRLASLVEVTHAQVVSDARNSGVEDPGAYADAVCVYLALGVSKLTDYNSTLVSWSQHRDQAAHVFTKQALPMLWDFAEVNPFADAAGDLNVSIAGIARALEAMPDAGIGVAVQQDARTADSKDSGKFVISTDPPYFDNISYADLSDYFYVWLRRSLKFLKSPVLQTILVPKDDELVASPYRHNGMAEAEAFFMQGMSEALVAARARACPGLPLTIYYAFKQTEESGDGTASTGWEAFLEALLRAGMTITATWPLRTERSSRSISIGTNALASSIVLACRVRGDQAPAVSRREFVKELERALPAALSDMTADPAASVAPVDLQQAAIGPGMAIFSRHKAVLESDGSSMSVHDALVLINRAIDAYFAEAEGELDDDTRFCIGWFQQYGFEAGPYGEADVLARAKGTAVAGIAEAGVAQSGRGKVRLFSVKEYPKRWDPQTDSRVPVWEACHQMCRALSESEADAGQLLARLPEKADAVRRLAYRLYTLCERKGWAEQARPYNELIASWPGIVEASRAAGVRGEQLGLV